jgi:hypothetical protein
MEIKLPRRRAEIHTINQWAADKFNVKTGTIIPCHVLGIYQSQDVGYAGAVCLCELFDGTMIELDPKYVVFTDIDKDGEII